MRLHVPDGVLFGSSAAHKAIRKEIIENNRLEAVISMPSGAFKPYAGVSTAVLVFAKTGHGGTDKVWFYDMKADGFSLDDKRSEIADNDIPDIVKRFHNLDGETERERTEQSFFVPKEEIVENAYDLSINKYKKIEYIPVEYPPTEEILKELRKLEAEIKVEMEELLKKSMTDFSVLQEAPFTDRGSITEVFTDVSVWLGIKNTIDMINANALAA